MKRLLNCIGGGSINDIQLWQNQKFNYGMIEETFQGTIRIRKENYYQKH